MAIFPKVQSLCPYKGNLAEIMDGGVCRLCKREVYDLSDMTDGQRVTFMKGCTAEVCVSYRFKMSPVAAAAVAAIALVGVPAAAAACETAETTVVVVGGIKDPSNAEYVRDRSDSTVPDLPVVYESAGPASTSPVDDGKHPIVVSATAQAGS